MILWNELGHICCAWQLYSSGNLIIRLGFSLSFFYEWLNVKTHCWYVVVVACLVTYLLTCALTIVGLTMRNIYLRYILLYMLRFATRHSILAHGELSQDICRWITDPAKLLHQCPSCDSNENTISTSTMCTSIYSYFSDIFHFSVFQSQSFHMTRYYPSWDKFSDIFIRTTEHLFARQWVLMGYWQHAIIVSPGIETGFGFDPCG